VRAWEDQRNSMAKVKNNVLVRGLSGAVGNAVFRQMPDGSTWVSASPDFSRRKFSKGQKAHQSRFQQAASYARGAAQVHPIYAELAKGTTKNAYNIALSDWFNPPVIHRIERKDGQVWVEASDNVMVIKVRVRILDEDRKILEEGEAQQADALSSEWWVYDSNAHGQIIAEAWDLAGNMTKLVL